MSASQALRAVASNGRCLHRTQSSSQELHHMNAPQDDEIAATAEANSERDAGAGTKGSSSSQEHYQAPVHRDDGTAAVREAVLEGCIGAGKTGSPSPGGGQQKNAGPPGPGGGRNSKSNQANEKVNQSQQAEGAVMRNANLVASSLNITPRAENQSDTADNLERGPSSTRTSSRRRSTVPKVTGEEQISACEWKKRMGLICTRECTCSNSIPRREEERVSKVRGMDVAADSWGVVANTDILAGEILTVFGGTTYILGSTQVGKEFS